MSAYARCLDAAYAGIGARLWSVVQTPEERLDQSSDEHFGPLPEYILFILSLVASGIIGGLSYDTFRRVIERMIQKVFPSRAPCTGSVAMLLERAGCEQEGESFKETILLIVASDRSGEQLKRTIEGFLTGLLESSASSGASRAPRPQKEGHQ